MTATERRRRATGVGVVAIAAAVLPLLGEAIGRAPLAIDRGLILAVRAADPHARLLGVATDVTALGSGPVLALLLLLVAGWLWALGRWRMAVLLLAACWSEGRAVDLVKHWIARPRPTLVPHWIAVADYSFPSAHSADSVTAYLLLAAIAASGVASRTARRYVFAAAALLVLLIGCTRIYLAVHWPSDVLSGWCFGAAWALGWWRAFGRSGARE